MIHEFTSIVLSGGAMKCIATLGCIEALYEKQGDECIRNYIGTSAGAIICCALCIGMKPNECLSFIDECFKSPDISRFDPLEVLNILSSFGCSSGRNLDILIERLLSRGKFTKDTTFIEFTKKTGKNLVICGTNISKERAEYFCIDNTPSMPVSMALRISCSIPIIFAPVKYNGDLYCDGMVYKNIPIDYFDKSQVRNIFAVNIYQKTKTIKQDSFIQYILSVIFAPQRQLIRNHIESSKEANIITVDMEDDLSYFDINALSIKITTEQLKQIYMKGYDVAKSQLMT